MKLNQKDDTQDDKDLSILNEIKTQLDLSQLALQIKNAQFTWPEREKCQEQEIQVSQQIKISSENQKLIEMESQTKIDCKEQEKFKLKVSDLTIRKGELVIIIGKIGSGKSALLQGILNELEAKFNNTFIDKKDRNESNNYENKILINGNIGYVSQNHWLQNKSIKENILFGKEFDPIWYKQCVESCDLQVDFNQFSKKDEKLAGPGGSNLSGGQRQRVAICRAIYQSCDIYLFDDILSSLDAHVANHIYQSVIFDLLIKKYQKTVLLVTSHFSIFSDRQLINQVYYLQGGKLTNNSQEIEQFIQNTITQEQTDQNSKQHDLIIEQTEHKHQETSILNSNLNDSSKSNEGHENEFEEISEHKKYKQQESEDQQQENLSETSEKEEEEEDQEEREKGNIKLSTFKVYFKSVGIATLTLLLVFNFLAPASQMLIDFWLKDQISSSSNKLFEYLNEIFSTFALTFLFLIVVQTLISFVRGLLIYASYLNCSQKIFQQLNQTIIFSLMRFFDKNSIGSIVSRLSEDIYTVDQYLPWSLDLLLGQSAPALLYTLAILAQFPWLSIFILVQFFLISFVQKDFRLLNREVKRLNSVNQGRVLTVLDESSKGLVLIRSFNKQIHILGEYLSKLSEFVNTNLITEAIQIWLSLRLIFISNLIFICVSASTIVIIFGGYDFEYTNIAMCITYSMIFSSRISEVIRFLNYFEMNIVSVERIKKYFDNQQEDLDENSFKRQSDLDQSKILNKQQEEEGIAIEFENFYLTYDEIDQNTDQSNEQTQIKFALEDISLKIKKGEKIAFCGRTGSGKTSILNAIFRMYPIKYGRIYLNGQDIQFQSLRQIRSQMSIIPQFGFVYNASLIDNIDPERKIAREQIQQKVNETNLRITKNLNQVKSQNIKDKQAQEYLIQENQSLICEEIQNKQDLDENLDFEIQDGGQNLSNGEKQVVNFLRIIMRDTEIICLDEATSNMDPETDSQLHKQIFKFAQNKTLLVITHRLENIELFDRVVVLDNGKIVESGHVSQLKNIQGGFFNKLTKSK